MQGGDRITVWVDDKKVLVHTAKTKLAGKYALLGANGKYVFRDVKYDAVSSSGMRMASGGL